MIKTEFSWPEWSTRKVTVKGNNQSRVEIYLTNDGSSKILKLSIQLLLQQKVLMKRILIHFGE